MSESSKQTDIVNDILDAVFDKPWAVYSPEEYKHQLAETQAEVKKRTPDEETKKMNKPLNIEKQPVSWYNAYVSSVLYTGCFAERS